MTTFRHPPPPFLSGSSLLLLLLCVVVAVSNAQKDSNGDDGKGKGNGYGASIMAMEYVPVGHVRTDPIISQDCLSDHVHTFYGPPKIHPTVTYEELRSGKDGGIPPEATSGNVVENQSLYWHPTFYRVEPDSGKREILEPDWTTIYYSFVKGATTAFPEGFRMIGGPPNGLKYTCYSREDSKGEYEGNKAEYEAKGKVEGDYKGDYKDEGEGEGDDNKGEGTYDEKDETTDLPSAGSYLPEEPCGELAVSLVFPTCWDGTSLDSDNHRDHVVYAAGRESGQLDTFTGADFECPSTHPVLLPQILLFIRFLNYPGGAVELSNADANWHADYVFGWDRDFLQGVLDSCDDVKGIPCGSTRLRGIDHGETETGSSEWADMVDMLRSSRVPMAETGCITEEPVDGIDLLPRGGCVGEVLTADSCAQPEFPPALLLAAGEGGGDSAGANPPASVGEGGGDFSGVPRPARAISTVLAAAVFLIVSFGI